MNPFLRAIASVSLLAGTLVSCTSGVSYSDSLARIDEHLEAKKASKKLFRLERSREEGKTAFRFVDGPPSKVNVVAPTWVDVTIRSHKNGADSSIDVVAGQQGLIFGSWWDLDTAARWRQDLRETIRTEQDDARQPATRPESDSKGDEKPLPESAGRSR